jgi:pyruvate-ferredoxin/flavodoxin oxidoreductase
MGSAIGTCEEVVDELLTRGEKVGVLKVRLFRPFSAQHLLAVLPESVKTIAVLDRTKEPGALAEPLYLDVMTALAEAFNMVNVKRCPALSVDATDYHPKSLARIAYWPSSMNCVPANLNRVLPSAFMMT